MNNEIIEEYSFWIVFQLDKFDIGKLSRLFNAMDYMIRSNDGPILDMIIEV